MLDINLIRITYTVTDIITNEDALNVKNLLIKDQDKLGVIISDFKYNDYTYLINYNIPVTKEFSGLFRVTSSIERAIKKVYH